MGSIVVSTTLARAATTLLDAGFVRWTASELLAHFNAGIRTILGIKPDAYVLTSLISLVAGAKQSLPAGATAPRGFRRNMGADGLLPGAAIVQVERDDLDSCRPEWMSTPGDMVQHVVTDPNDPRTFYVYPQINPWQIEATYAAVPGAVAEGSTYPIDDIYEDPLWHYIISAAMAKSSLSGDIVKCNWHAQQFATALGVKHQGQMRFTQQSPQQEQAKEKA